MPWPNVPAKIHGPKTETPALARGARRALRNLELPYVISATIAWAERAGQRRHHRAPQDHPARLIVEIAILDRHDLRAFQLVLVVVAVVEAHDAPLHADRFDNPRRFEDMVLLGVALDDRDLVVLVIAVGDRDRMRGRGAHQGCKRSRKHPFGHLGSLLAERQNTGFLLLCRLLGSSFLRRSGGLGGGLLRGGLLGRCLHLVRPSVGGPAFGCGP